VSGLARSVDRGVLPAHELPVEFLAPAESISKANGSSVVAKNLRRQATSLWHAVLEDDATNTGVDERHRAHDARLVGKEDFELQAKIAVRHEVVALEVLLLEVIKGKVEEKGVASLLVKAKSSGGKCLLSLVGTAAVGGRSDTQALTADHADSAHDGMAHWVSVAWMIASRLASNVCGIWHRFEAGVSGGSDDLCLVINSLHNHATGSSLGVSLVVCLFTGSLGQSKSIGDAKVANERMLKVALGLGDGAGMGAKGVGLAVEGGPVLLGPLLCLLRLGGRLTRNGGFLDLEREGPRLGVGAEGRVFQHEVVKVREGDQVGRADEQVQGERLLVDGGLFGWVRPFPTVSFGVLEHSLRGRIVPGASDGVHLFDEVTLADDMLGHEAGTGEATEVLEVDSILAGNVVFDYSAGIVSMYMYVLDAI